MTTAWLTAAILAALLLAMLGLLTLGRGQLIAYPELSRKLAHVSLGMVALTFPWLFTEVGPVVAIAGAAAAVLVAVRTVPALRARVGPVFFGVRRASWGDLYFPAAVVALFVLSRGDPILYVIPILTLTVADALAALVGLRYGTVYYTTVRGRKSVEGSVAFLVVAFLAAHLTLLLLSPVGRLESVLVAAIFGVLVMLLEAVAWAGLDNLFVPIGGYIALARALPMNTRFLGVNLVVAILLMALVLVARHRQTLDDSGLLAGVLIGYLSWDIGGWQWLVPPLAVFIAYPALFPRADQQAERPHDLVALGTTTLAGCCWLAIAHGPRAPAAYFAYTLAFAVTLCFIGLTWFHVARPKIARWRAITTSAAIAWIVLFVPFALVQRTGEASIQSAAGMLIMLVAATVYARIVLNDGTRRHPWERQALLTLAASVLGFVVAVP